MIKVTELKKPKNSQSLTIRKNKDGNYLISYTETLNKQNEKKARRLAQIVKILQSQGWKEL